MQPWESHQTYLTSISSFIEGKRRAVFRWWLYLKNCANVHGCSQEIVKQYCFSGQYLSESFLSPFPSFFKSEAGKQVLEQELEGIDWENKIRNIFIITSAAIIAKIGSHFIMKHDSVKQQLAKCQMKVIPLKCCFSPIKQRHASITITEYSYQRFFVFMQFSLAEGVSAVLYSAFLQQNNLAGNLCVNEKLHISIYNIY